MYISVYRHVYQPFTCISCFQTPVFRLNSVFSHFFDRYINISLCILVYTAVYRNISLFWTFRAFKFQFPALFAAFNLFRYSTI
uniref:Putative ovule protein n=1 Tax=Solanum chacoense TaxID=4108 RepID=A0A0V0HP41_SOLCH